MSARIAPTNPATLTYSALLCAAAACEHSEHASDRIFAAECIKELAERLDEPVRPDRKSDPRKQGFTKSQGRWIREGEPA